MVEQEKFKSIIIGGGISGLNIAHQLKNIKHDNDFVLLQDTLELDSRVNTYKDQTLTCELGASIFNATHNVLFDLIRYYKLEDKIVDITETNKTYYYIEGPDGYGLDQNEIVKRRDQIDERLKEKANDKMTLHQLLLKEFPNRGDRELYVSSSTGYYESKGRISSTYFKESDVVDNGKNKTFGMKGGLSQLVAALYENLKDHIRFGQKVKSIIKLSNKSYEIVARDSVTNHIIKYTTDKIYLCVNKTALLNINCVNVDLTPLLKLVKRVSSFREYIVFKEPIELWMNNYDYVMTNLHFHWMIKYNAKTIMIYTDGELADYLHSMDKKSRIEVYLRNLSKIFNREFKKTDIENIIDRYWSEAFVIVKRKYFDSYDEIIKTIEDQSIIQTITPKNKGFSEGWMEASLIKI
jgi:monoamine oxidase